MNKILGIGNALLDVLVKIEDDTILQTMRLPKGSMQWVDDIQHQQILDFFATQQAHMSCGGSSANTVKALGRLGNGVSFLGKVGHDEYGDFYEQELKQHGVIPLLLRSEKSTGTCSAFITSDGERTFGDCMGASLTLDVSELLPSMFEGFDYVYIEGYMVQNPALLLRAVQLSKNAHAQVCLDLASYNVVENNLPFFKDLITRYVDIVFANEDEARSFTGKPAEEAVAEIASLCSIAVVKVGERGSYIRKGTESIQMPAIAVPQVVDTTGAGDLYAAGFLHGLIQGFSLEKCGKIATLLAAHVIQTMGTTFAPEQWNVIREEINQMFRIA